MDIIDLHCDVLEKLTRLEAVDFQNDNRLHANLNYLQAGKVKVQVFAIFIHPNVPQKEKFLEAARQIEAFHTKVLSKSEMVHITDWRQLDELKEGEIGAVLSLEGCDCIGEDIGKLQHLIDAGVKIVGLTWNEENTVAYGTSEAPSKGLKPFAHEVIQLLNQHDILLDVAHLNEQGFYEVLPLAKHIIASHCNARSICDHPRNLTDEQIKALVQNGGRIHVVFYPPFIEPAKETTTINELLKHIQHLTSLVGVESIGFGSDFDGMDPLAIEKLSNASEYQNLINALLNTYSIEEVQMMASKGFRNYVMGIGKREK
ncbi:membrane dipeptidase [Lysinibacillus halotolerans]|uniref:Membrane dipeptidase n=1 Tax=Lysinibacillus halotolerans TaxID=1368476 RepID=A0A3M8H1Y7_9BACI|nr:membrane dipeptidase [Lysinibacillus halotolerans]RNC96174.1 membrane dipeptidase [Lysinibacillus halotolerans]